MRVLVCGGRAYDDKKELNAKLNAFHQKHGIDLLIHGAARGADLMAEEWAKKRQIPYVGVPAQWGKHGRKAGPIRNKEMLETWIPDAVIAFPGGTGTSHMVGLAAEASIPFWQII